MYGAALLASGVAIGAFGAHGLRRVVTDASLLNAFEVGVRYQLIHGVGLLALGALPRDVLRPLASPPGEHHHAAGDVLSSFTGRAPEMLLAGTTLFSGSLYALAITKPASRPPWLGPVTPLGGLVQIAGWCAFGLGVIRLC
jgi:uncharacterized membrane protein YgdD (TMEM256/DUF423 family)